MGVGLFLMQDKAKVTFRPDHFRELSELLKHISKELFVMEPTEQRRLIQLYMAVFHKLDVRMQRRAIDSAHKKSIRFTFEPEEAIAFMLIMQYENIRQAYEHNAFLCWLVSTTIQKIDQHYV